MADSPVVNNSTAVPAPAVVPVPQSYVFSDAQLEALVTKLTAKVPGVVARAETAAKTDMTALRDKVLRVISDAEGEVKAAVPVVEKDASAVWHTVAHYAMSGGSLLISVLTMLKVL